MSSPSNFISAQFSWRLYLCTWESPCAHSPIFQKFPQNCLSNSSNVSLISMALSHPFKEDCWTLSLSTPLPFKWSMVWFPFLGFVPTGSVSSSSALQIFQDVIHFCTLTYCIESFHQVPWQEGGEEECQVWDELWGRGCGSCDPQDWAWWRWRLSLWGQQPPRPCADRRNLVRPQWVMFLSEGWRTTQNKKINKFFLFYAAGLYMVKDPLVVKN